MIAESFTTEMAAAALGLSPKTVEYHRRTLMRRMGIFDVAGLTREAIRLGIIALDRSDLRI